MFKRRISIEQLQELTAEQQQKLREWWEPQNGDYYSYTYYCISTQYKEENCIGVYDKKYPIENALPLLDIGQMIELLGINMVSCVQYVTPAWVVHFNAKEYGDVELADALWEAVKQVLGV